MMLEEELDRLSLRKNRQTDRQNVRSSWKSKGFNSKSQQLIISLSLSLFCFQDVVRKHCVCVCVFVLCLVDRLSLRSLLLSSLLLGRTEIILLFRVSCFLKQQLVEFSSLREKNAKKGIAMYVYNVIIWQCLFRRRSH